MEPVVPRGRARGEYGQCLADLRPAAALGQSWAARAQRQRGAPHANYSGAAYQFGSLADQGTTASCGNTGAFYRVGKARNRQSTELNVRYSAHRGRRGSTVRQHADNLKAVNQHSCIDYYRVEYCTDSQLANGRCLHAAYPQCGQQPNMPNFQTPACPVYNPPQAQNAMQVVGHQQQAANNPNAMEVD